MHKNKLKEFIRLRGRNIKHIVLLFISRIYIRTSFYFLFQILKYYKNHSSSDAIILRQKREVLFVTEKWWDCNPTAGYSNNQNNLFGSLESTGIAVQDHFYFDEFCLDNKRSCDVALLRYCLEKKPDMVFYSWCGDRYGPKWETFNIIKNKLSIPVVAIWWEVLDMAEANLKNIDLNIVLHSDYIKKTKNIEKYLLMWTPQNKRIFYNQGIKRDIHISFIGDRKRPEREKGISVLQNNGLNVYLAGGREQFLSIYEYANLYMRSKIALNFSRGMYCSNNVLFPISHAKGRIFEAISCGAMLLEDDNPETKIWFEPMVDYVPFEDETDLVEKTKYYIEHDAEREIIAAHGCKKVNEMYSSDAFWKIVFAKIFDNNS